MTTIHWDEGVIELFNTHLKKSGARIVEAREKQDMNGGYIFSVSCTEEIDLQQQMQDFINWYVVNGVGRKR
jgi:hypothetical protein